MGSTGRWAPQLGLDSGWLIQLDNPNAVGSRYRVLAIGNNENVLGLRQWAEQRCAKRCGKYVHAQFGWARKRGWHVKLP